MLDRIMSEQMNIGRNKKLLEMFAKTIYNINSKRCGYYDDFITTAKRRCSGS